jgi:signal transduction histidine kinase
VAIAGLLAVAMTLLGYGVVLVSARFNARDMRNRTDLITNTLQKAAGDALLQKDDLLLVSYVNFVRTQYPSVGQVRLQWQAGGRLRPLTVGTSVQGHELETRGVSVVDPADAGRRVDISFDLDLDNMREVVGHDERRLMKIMLLVASVTLLAGVILAFWLAHTVTAPVAQLDRLAADIAAGKLGARMSWSSQDEIGRLVTSFNQMSRKLEELDETKKNFVSSVTHELRSPLGAIESFLVLVDGKIGASVNGDAAQCKEYIGRIQVNVQRLTRFINDLLDVAKIEKGKMECALRPMDLAPVAAEVCEFFGPKAQQQGVAVTQSLKGVPSVQGDPERLRQVLVNLVANSLKFTQSGGSVTISAEQFREGRQRWVEVTVADTGRGMTADDQEKLFQAFSQGANSSERVVGTKGTGLGLYITKSIIEQHGGKIGVRSTPGQGTAVTFSLQAA